MWRALIPLLLLAGCTQPNGPAGEGAPDAPRADGLPENYEVTGEVVAQGDPVIVASGAPCSTPGSQCARYPFTLNESAEVLAFLTWTLAANDFDLYIFAEGAPTSSEGTNAGPSAQTSASVAEILPPGEYEVVVVPFFVGRDTYTLAVEFAPTAA